MKLNTFPKGILTCVLASTLALSVCACNKKEEPQQLKESVQQESEREYRVIRIPAEEKKYGEIELKLYPKSKTGQNLYIYAQTKDGCTPFLAYWDVKLMELYEDGIKIESEEGGPWGETISKTVKYEEPGIHSYSIKVFYENGEVEVFRESETKQVEFTGKILDVPPEETRISCSHNILEVYGEDYGDNRGIVNVKVYEDEKVWKEFNREPTKFWISDDFHKDIPLNLEKTGKHKYYAEFTDKGGNTVKTNTIIINYDSE